MTQARKPVILVNKAAKLAIGSNTGGTSESHLDKADRRCRWEQHEEMPALQEDRGL